MTKIKRNRAGLCGNMSMKFCAIGKYVFFYKMYVKMPVGVAICGGKVFFTISKFVLYQEPRCHPDPALNNIRSSWSIVY